jgi:hypothetical protein
VTLFWLLNHTRRQPCDEANRGAEQRTSQDLLPESRCEVIVDESSEALEAAVVKPHDHVSPVGPMTNRVEEKIDSGEVQEATKTSRRISRLGSHRDSNAEFAAASTHGIAEHAEESAGRGNY